MSVSLGQFDRQKLDSPTYIYYGLLMQIYFDRTIGLNQFLVHQNHNVKLHIMSTINHSQVISLTS